MTHRLLWFVVMVTVASRIVSVAGQGHEFAFTTIDFPGAVFTNVQGINAGGDIVGFYTDKSGKTHGFVSNGGDFRSVDYKDSKSTQLRGIGPAGDIVGTYQRQNESGAVPVHGFLLTRHGEFTPIDHPEHQNTITQRILANGTILGCYHDSDTMGTMHGLSLSRRGFDALAEATTMHNGATPDGRLIVGLFTDMMDNRGKGYFFDGARFTAFEVPGATFTAAWDISPAGVAVGVFRDGAGRFHGFTYDGVSFGQVDVPDATATRVFGINAGGDLVGTYVDTTGSTHGFLARRPR